MQRGHTSAHPDLLFFFYSSLLSLLCSKTNQISCYCPSEYVLFERISIKIAPFRLTINPNHDILMQGAGTLMVDTVLPFSFQSQSNSLLVSFNFFLEETPQNQIRHRAGAFIQVFHLDRTCNFTHRSNRAEPSVGATLLQHLE